ncbi:hypothetical protein [Streptomyces sp. B6B3]|uniref:hypothetical protein n=1 Tax=Streptomyces sp. B6B3 TaxID=3153570 RepID=UPI00325ED6FF
MTGMITGCSSDDGGEEPIEGAETESSGSDEEQNGADEGQEADVAALTDLYETYWDALVQLDNSTDPDPALLEGLATQSATETEISRMQAYHAQGIRRQGEPTFGDITVTVDGDTAIIEACKSESDWQFVDENGEEVEVEGDLTVREPNVVAAERSSDGWLIGDTLAMEEATISC